MDQLLPVFLVVAGHDRGDDDSVGVVVLELADSGDPVSGSLLGNEFDVHEASLVGTVVITRSGATNDTRGDVGDEILVKRKGLGDCETETSFEGATDHGGRSGVGGRCDTKRVGELHAAEIDGDVDVVDGSAEARNLGIRNIDLLAFEALEVSVDTPRCGLAVVGGFDSDGTTSNITTSEGPRSALDLARGGIDGDSSCLGIESVTREVGEFFGKRSLSSDFRSESGDDVVTLDSHCLIFVLDVGSIGLLLHLVELDTNNLLASVVEEDLLGLAVRQELRHLLLGSEELLFDRAHVSERATEGDDDAVSTAAEGGARAIEGSVTSAENEDLLASHVGQVSDALVAFTLLGDGEILGDLTDTRQEALGGVETHRGVQVAELLDDVGIGETGTNKDSLVAVLFEGLDGDVGAECLGVVEVDTEILGLVDFPRGVKSLIRRFDLIRGTV